MKLVIVSIYDARDPAHRLRTAPGQKEDALGKLPKWVMLRVKEPANLFLEGRNPVGMLGIDAPRQVNEVL